MTFHRLIQGLAGFLGLAAIEWTLYLTGDGLLQGPRLHDPGSWPPWLVSRPPDVALLALLRLVGLALGGCLLAAYGLGLALRMVRLRGAVHRLDVVTPAALRSFLDRVTGVAAAGAVAVAGVATTAGPAAAVGSEPVAVHGKPAPHHGPPVTLRGLAGPQPDPTPTTTTTVGRLPVVTPPATIPVRQEPTPPPRPHAPAAPSDSAIPLPPATVTPAAPPQAAPAANGPADGASGAVPIDDDAPGPTDHHRTAPPHRAERPPDAGTGAADDGHGPVAEEPGSAAAPPATGDGGRPATARTTWEVQPGDHFWAIADHALHEGWGRAPSDTELVPYWRILIEHNRSRLADPANPDLLFPGQVLELPPLPVRPAA